LAALYAFFVGAIIGNFWVVVDFSESLSKDLLEHASPERIQESLKNNWTNTAILSGLLFTIVASYSTEVYFEDERLKEASDGLMFLYMLFLSVSFGEYLIAIITATVHLTYTDSLSAVDAVTYYRDNPRSPGGPAVWMVCAIFWHIMATWMLYQSTTLFAYLFPIAMAIALFWVVSTIRQASRWAPEELEVWSEEKQGWFHAIVRRVSEDGALDVSNTEHGKMALHDESRWIHVKAERRAEDTRKLVKIKEI
jgi:hypothetical protein